MKNFDTAVWDREVRPDVMVLAFDFEFFIEIYDLQFLHWNVKFWSKCMEWMYAIQCLSFQGCKQIDRLDIQ